MPTKDINAVLVQTKPSCYPTRRTQSMNTLSGGTGDIGPSIEGFGLTGVPGIVREMYVNGINWIHSLRSGNKCVGYPLASLSLRSQKAGAPPANTR